MKKIGFLIVLLIAGLIFISCGDESSNDNSGGSSGGSGEVDNSAATARESESAATEEEEQTAQQEEQPQSQAQTAVTSSNIFLDAFSDFNCSGNWGDRDGALGIKAYSGSGTCTASFPGASGSYQMVLKARTEYDGRSPYRVSIDGTQVAAGEYPLSSPLGCDCPQDNWREVCPDKDVDINLGVFTLNTGATIEFWGDDVYPCGDHGAYAKWHGIEIFRR